MAMSETDTELELVPEGGNQFMDYLPAVEMEFPREVLVNSSIIWLHGLGADGNDFAPIVPQLDLSEVYGIRFIFPHAPTIPVTINNGHVMPAWYDIKQLNIERSANEEQLRQSAAWVHALIEREIERGVDSSRIIIAGFSQGGAVSFEAALSYSKPLAGIMALSTYFPTAETIQMDSINSQLPILICHGSLDSVVAESMGQQSFTTLQEMGFKPEYKSYPMEHAVCPQEVEDIASWIRKLLDPAE